jgi:MFS family permease
MDKILPNKIPRKYIVLALIATIALLFIIPGIIVMKDSQKYERNYESCLERYSNSPHYNGWCDSPDSERLSSYLSLLFAFTFRFIPIMILLIIMYLSSSNGKKIDVSRNDVKKKVSDKFILKLWKVMIIVSIVLIVIIILSLIVIDTILPMIFSGSGNCHSWWSGTNSCGFFESLFSNLIYGLLFATLASPVIIIIIMGIIGGLIHLSYLVYKKLKK